MSIINILAPFENISISINKVTCENIDIDFCIDEKILKNINTDKEILKKIHIDKGILEKNYLDVDRDIFFFFCCRFLFLNFFLTKNLCLNITIFLKY